MITLVLYLLAANLLILHGPGNQSIVINPREIVSIRDPTSEEHFAKGIRCLINTTDGKFATVQEDCKTVETMLEAMQ